MKFLAAIFCLLAATTSANAHAFLDRAEPKVGSTVDSSPTAIRIWFTDDLKASQSSVAVFDSSGKEVDQKDVKIDTKIKSLMSVSVPALPAGTYKVQWNAVCPLGHHTSGSFTFEVKLVAAGKTP